MYIKIEKHIGRLLAILLLGLCPLLGSDLDILPTALQPPPGWFLKSKNAFAPTSGEPLRVTVGTRLGDFTLADIYSKTFCGMAGLGNNCAVPPMPEIKRVGDFNMVVGYWTIRSTVVYINVVTSAYGAGVFVYVIPYDMAVGLTGAAFKPSVELLQKEWFAKDLASLRLAHHQAMEGTMDQMLKYGHDELNRMYFQKQFNKHHQKP